LAACATKLPHDPRLAALCQLFSLHSGEQDALVQLEDDPQPIFLTDDSAASQVSPWSLIYEASKND